MLVLGLITLTAFLLSQFIERSLTEMLVEARARQAERLRVDAHSALEASLAVLAGYQALDGGLRAPTQGWGEPLDGLDFVAREGRVVQVKIEDESGRISLPRLGATELAALGRQLGLKAAEAERLADALLTWTRRDHAATRLATSAANYERADPPHRPPGRPLASFDELAAIAGAREFFYTRDGRPTPLRGEFLHSVSLYDFPAANLNSARPATLALAGLDENQAERIIAHRGGRGPRAPGSPPYFRSVAEAKTVLGLTVPLDRFDTLARCLRVGVIVREGVTAFHLTAVVVPLAETPAEGQAAGGDARADASSLRYPFRLLALEENIESIPPSAS